MDPEPCSSQATMGTHPLQAPERECPTVVTGPLRHHHLGLLRLLAPFQAHPQPHQLGKQQTLKKAILVDMSSSQLLLILRCIPALKMEKLRTYTVETKRMVT